MARGNFKEAFNLLKKGMEKNPHDCILLEGFVKANWMMGNYGSVASNSERMKTACPDISAAHLYLGLVAHKKFQKKEAKDHFKRYLQMGGDKAMVPDGF